jgi:hypothetical protein
LLDQARACVNDQIDSSAPPAEPQFFRSIKSHHVRFG